MAEARAAAAETPAATAAGGSRDAAAEDAAPIREAGEERAGRQTHAREEEVVHPLPPAGKAQAGKGGPRASNSSNMEQIASTRVNTLVRQQNDSTKKFRVSDVLESTMGVSEYHKELHRLPTTIHEEIALPPSQAKLLYLIHRLTSELEVTDLDMVEEQETFLLERTQSSEATTLERTPSSGKATPRGSTNNWDKSFNRTAANSFIHGFARASGATNGAVTAGSRIKKKWGFKQMVKAVTQASDFVKHIHRPSGERWIRRINLLVYIYEATVAQVFTDYDYAPGLEYCGTSEIPLNVCQEGLDDLYDLQERGFILQLNLASRSHRNIAAYQLSSRGRRMIDLNQDEGGIEDCNRHAVDVFCAKWLKLDAERAKLLITEALAMTHVPKEDKRAVESVRPFEIVQERGHFELISADARRWSTVTHFEDVSYACSPYLPDVLKAYGQEPACPPYSEAVRLAGIKAVNVRAPLKPLLAPS